MNDFRERIEQYNGELVQVKIHFINKVLSEWRCKKYVLSCERNSTTMLMLQMLIEKDELQQEQEGVLSSSKSILECFLFPAFDII